MGFGPSLSNIVLGEKPEKNGTFFGSAEGKLSLQALMIFNKSVKLRVRSRIEHEFTLIPKALLKLSRFLLFPTPSMMS